MTLKIIKQDDPTLKQVIALWRANSATLGFFPEGAFQEYASKEQIIGAINKDGQCVAYLLYRTSGERAFIVHLCVHGKARGKGIARDLLAKLSEETKDLDGICLWCRRDYAASAIWQELGFVALAEKPGKNTEGKELTFWRRDNERPGLFSSPTTGSSTARLRAAIDASVFFDLVSEDTPRDRESLSLRADWISPSLELCITDEIFNEVNRRQITSERKRSRELARSYEILSPPASSWEAMESTIRRLYPRSISTQDKSDIRHLAKALASDIQVFITRDGPLLRKGERLYKEFGLTVTRPSDIVIRLDELRRETAYQPARFGRTLFQAGPIRAGEASELTKHFQCPNLGEGQAQFQEYLGQALAYPDKFECILIRDPDQNPLALIAYRRETHETLEIPLLRIRQGQLASTLARNLAFIFLSLGAREARPRIHITEPFLSETICDALKEEHFFKTTTGWIKIALPFVGNSHELLKKIQPFIDLDVLATSFHSHLAQTVQANIFGAASIRLAEQLERAFWPAKISDLEIPNYIIPIQPRWAQELFDEGLAGQTLFGARPELGLNREGVYYRSRKSSGGLSGPSRILWYVSSNKKYQGSMQVRACSYVDNVVVDKAKTLFRQYRRFGVYEWKDISKLSVGDAASEIMAVLFSDTELFSRPLSWECVQRILREEGTPSQIQSPHRISSKTFFRIYRLGTDR